MDGRPVVEQRVGRREIVAGEHHVAARDERFVRARNDIPGPKRACHPEVIGEDESVETEPLAQDLA